MLNLIPLPYKLLAGAALIVGVFFYGYTKGSAHAEAEIAKFAAKKTEQAVKIEKKNAEISNNVQIKYVDRTRVIKEKEYVYRDLAKTVVPSQHTLSNGWVYTHNLSATAGNADATRAADETSSGIKDNDALATIVSNYSICMQNSEQLIGLQKWVNDNKHAIEKVEEEKKKK